MTRRVCLTTATTKRISSIERERSMVTVGSGVTKDVRGKIRWRTAYGGVVMSNETEAVLVAAESAKQAATAATQAAGKYHHKTETYLARYAEHNARLQTWIGGYGAG